MFVGLWYGFLLGAAAYKAWQNSYFRSWFYLYVAILIAGLIYQRDIFGVACCVTALTLFITALTGRIATAMNWRWVQFLGLISYSLYLIHNPITGAIFHAGFILTGHSIEAEALWWAVSLLVSTGAATIFYFVMELPSKNLSNSLFVRPKAMQKKPKMIDDITESTNSI